MNGRSINNWSRACTLAVAATLASCATQAPYQRPAIDLPAAWSNVTADAPAGSQSAVIDGDVAWWPRLKDPAIDALVQAALSDNPTLVQAVATIDEARATLAISTAQRVPQVGVSGAAARAQAANPVSLTGGTIIENSAVLGPNLSWEVDLWGRLKESATAARDRLDARTFDAAEVRLSLAAQVADGVLGLRACDYSLSVRDRDIASREIELSLTRQRRLSGNLAPVDEANAATNLDNARTDRISQQEQCIRDIDALVALSGRGSATVQALMAKPLAAGTPILPNSVGAAPPAIIDVNAAALMPTPPPIQLAVPATILLAHPTVESAEREAAARWSEIAVARADRLPKVDLGAALTGNWLQALGVGAGFETWSFVGSLSAPLFDAGAGAANVSGYEARYREAVADLRQSVRSAAQNVEDALAAQQSAEQRVDSSRQAVEAGRISVLGAEASWRAGSISIFELEDARRQFNAAQENAIAAARDRAQGWVNLVLASGGSTHREVPVATASDITPRKQPE